MAPLAWAMPSLAEDSYITVKALSGFQRGDQRAYFQVHAVAAEHASLSVMSIRLLCQSRPTTCREACLQSSGFAQRAHGWQHARQLL